MHRGARRSNFALLQSYQPVQRPLVLPRWLPRDRRVYSVGRRSRNPRGGQCRRHSDLHVLYDGHPSHRAMPHHVPRKARRAFPFLPRRRNAPNEAHNSRRDPPRTSATSQQCMNVVNRCLFQMAFTSMLETLKAYKEDRKLGRFRFHHGVISRRRDAKANDHSGYKLIDYLVQ